MSILDEFQECLTEARLAPLVATSGREVDSEGRTKIDKATVSAYDNAVRDCREHPSVDSAMDSVYKGLRAANLMPYTEDGAEWGGAFKNELDVGQGGVARINLRKDDKDVVNAHLKIDLYKNSDDEYEVSSRIVIGK